MKLPKRLINATCTILDAQYGPPDSLGQRKLLGWVERPGALPCGDFPAGEKLAREAQLKGVKVAREVFVESPALSVKDQRLRVTNGGRTTDYQITLVNEYTGEFTHLGVTT